MIIKAPLEFGACPIFLKNFIKDNCLKGTNHIASGGNHIVARGNRFATGENRFVRGGNRYVTRGRRVGDKGMTRIHTTANGGRWSSLPWFSRLSTSKPQLSIDH